MPTTGQTQLALLPVWDGPELLCSGLLGFILSEQILGTGDASLPLYQSYLR